MADGRLAVRGLFIGDDIECFHHAAALSLRVNFETLDAPMHTVRAGTDVVQAIREVGPRLFNMHMKDLTNFQSKESQVAVGDGIMPVRKMFEALIATKYQGFVDLEYEIHPDDPMPGVIASFAYMRGVLAGMGFSGQG
jgi:sugar phosphate isomerase/epimerase